jgi:hypothetical protein
LGEGERLWMQLTDTRVDAFRLHLQHAPRHQVVQACADTPAAVRFLDLQIELEDARPLILGRFREIRGGYDLSPHRRDVPLHRQAPLAMQPAPVLLDRHGRQIRMHLVVNGNDLLVNPPRWQGESALPSAATCHSADPAEMVCNGNIRRGVLHPPATFASACRVPIAHPAG